LAAFFWCKSYVWILGYFLTNSSDHPDFESYARKWQKYIIFVIIWSVRCCLWMGLICTDNAYNNGRFWIVG
jgi:hypothetical protein